MDIDGRRVFLVTGVARGVGRAYYIRHCASSGRIEDCPEIAQLELSSHGGPQKSLTLWMNGTKLNLGSMMFSCLFLLSSLTCLLVILSHHISNSTCQFSMGSWAWNLSTPVFHNVGANPVLMKTFVLRLPQPRDEPVVKKVQTKYMKMTRQVTPIDVDIGDTDPLLMTITMLIILYALEPTK